MIIDNPTISGSALISGSLTITGSLNVSGSISGLASNAVSASYALNATTASYALASTSASYSNNSTSASYAANSDLLDSRDSLTFANTGSNSFVGTQNINGAVAITGSLTTTGAITAQTLNVQQVTSSIVYSSGSNVFGNSISNTQSMTGSVGISGSLAVTGPTTITGILTLNSTISNGTYTYTLPSATGTLALTSDLSGYLPLTGGTLTGALSGTSATFSGVITSTITADGILSALTASTSRKFITIGNNGVTLNLGIENSAGGDLATGTSAYASVIASVGATRDLQLATNNTVRLSIASTGVASFSNSNLKVGSLGSNKDSGIEAGIVSTASLASVPNSLTLSNYNASATGHIKIELSDFDKSSAFITYSPTLTAATNLLGLYVGSIGTGLKINGSGAATFSSGISVGGATATTGGIQFPATQVAIADGNNLDDYEEGTWTPTWSSGGGTINTNVTFTAGTYTKIGNVVHIWARLYTNSVSSPTGVVTVSGLPFTVGTQVANQAMHLFTMNAINATLTGTPTIHFPTSTSTGIILNKIWNSSEFSGDIATYFDNDTWGYFYGTYNV
jgi:hypothetical protein